MHWPLRDEADSTERFRLISDKALTAYINKFGRRWEEVAWLMKMPCHDVVRPCDLGEGFGPVAARGRNTAAHSRVGTADRAVASGESLRFEAVDARCEDSKVQAAQSAAMEPPAEVAAKKKPCPS
eukprot:g33530.t1